MTEPILSKGYWSSRIETARKKGVIHESVFRCSLSQWEAVEEKHKQILKRILKPTDRILDAGCAYGRLLSLLPEEWQGEYVGIDHSPEFIALARQQHPTGLFLVADLQNLSLFFQESFDIAILISIRPMMIRNLGQEKWDKMEKEIRRVSKKLLFLEYDPNCEGFLE